MNTNNLRNIKKASQDLLRNTEDDKNTFLNHLAYFLKKKEQEIVLANHKDVRQAKKNNFSAAFIDRLILQEEGIQKLIIKLYEMRKLTSGIGDTIEHKTTLDGLTFRKVRVPIGVILVIYEARPEVTIDVAALCIKSGNAVILKGGSEALQTNKVLFKCICEALEKSNLNDKSIGFIDTKNRKLIETLLKRNNFIDLVIARGGYQMVKSIQESSKIPVLAHSAGGARFYIDKSADLSIVEKIIINAKITKPSACNSLDTIVIHKDLASNLLPALRKSLKESGVVIIDDDWNTEFLGMRVSIKIVENLDEAILFIHRYSKGHSEGIIAKDREIIRKFTSSIDTAAIFINCSSRLHDGYVFGLGSEIGIATGKLHARGPVGLKELTSYKWEVYGNGHIRK